MQVTAVRRRSCTVHAGRLNTLSKWDLDATIPLKPSRQTGDRHLAALQDLQRLPRKRHGAAVCSWSYRRAGSRSPRSKSSSARRMPPTSPRRWPVSSSSRMTPKGVVARGRRPELAYLVIGEHPLASDLLDRRLDAGGAVALEQLAVHAPAQAGAQMGEHLRGRDSARPSGSSTSQDLAPPSSSAGRPCSCAILLRRRDRASRPCRTPVAAASRHGEKLLDVVPSDRPRSLGLALAVLPRPALGDTVDAAFGAGPDLAARPGPWPA